MPPFELLLPFIIATSIFAFTPGPGMLYMSIQTMARGQNAGWLSAVAFHLASYVHIFSAAFGVTVLLQTLPFLFVALKVAGAAYLIWMGVRMIKNSGDRIALTELDPQKSARQAFKDSLTVELLNPKTALFYFAFLPQFTSPEASAPIWVQIAVLGTFANFAFSITDGVCILFSKKLAVWAAASQKMTRIGRQVSGSFFILMGLHIAVRND